MNFARRKNTDFGLKRLPTSKNRKNKPNKPTNPKRKKTKMIMSDTSTSGWENPTLGLHGAVCCDVADLGLRMTKHGEKHQIQLTFTLDQNKTDGRPITINRKYNQSLHPDSDFRKDLKTWRGADLTDAEKAGFNTEMLVGAQAQINIEEFQKHDGTPGTSIGAILPPADGQSVKADPDYERVQDRKPKTEEGEPF